MADIEELKRLNRIEDVIEELGMPLDKRTRGKYLTPPKGTKEGGLVVNTDEQIYFWNSKGEGGDVLDYLQRYHGHDFKSAMQYLADRAGVQLTSDPEEMRRMQVYRAKLDALTAGMKYFQEKLRGSAAAKEYCAGRGWTEETVEKAGLGFWDGDVQGLKNHLQMHQVDLKSEVAQALTGIPHGMLIYGHMAGARCEYVSGRSIAEKRHYNLPAALVGQRKPYWNHAVRHGGTHIVVCEGQADAVTLAQWGIPSIALAGVSAGEQLVNQLDDYERVYVAMDNDEAGKISGREIAATLGVTTLVVNWPKGSEEQPIKDANDWLKSGATEDDARLLLADASIFALWLCEQVEESPPLERDSLRDQAVALVARLPEFAYEKYKKSCAAALKVTIRELNGMCRALKKQDDKKSVHKQELTEPNGYRDGHLYELIYQPNHPEGPRTMFAVRYPDGRISTCRFLETENYRIYPPDGHETIVRDGFIKLPDRVGEYSNESELQQEIQAFVNKYVDVPQHIEVMASYYVMMTWMFDAFYVLPYLRARGDSDSGKSRFTETVGHLSFRPVFISGSTTPSPVFRLMQAWNGLTVVMDEADLPHSDTSADWIMMLNTGYKKGPGILRTNINNGDVKIEAFSAFGPKILNMRGKFIDDATESRCLTWETSSGRGVRQDIPRYMQREEFYDEAREIQNKLLRWRLRTFTQIEIDYNQDNTQHLPGRLVEITVSLMSISKSDEFKEEVRKFIEKMNQRAIMDRQMTLPAKVLEGMLRAAYVPDDKALEDDQKNRMSIGHITRQANMVIDKENAEAVIDDDDDGKDDGFKRKGGRGLGSQKVGWILSNVLNLEKERGVGQKPMCVVWDQKRVEALCHRYGMIELWNEIVAEGEELKKRLRSKASQKGFDIPV